VSAKRERSREVGGRAAGSERAAGGPTEDFLARVRADGLLRRRRPVVVLLSGGRDSTCLLDLAVRIAGSDAVTALHVNYRLRDAAGEDETHCRVLCERLGVALEVRHARRPDTGNVQAWARDERYGAAAQLALTRGADVGAGHTATDQVETILYRLVSSPSRRALLGMSPREGRLVRPLLGFTREQTTAYCVERGLSWREDESNASDGYARNRIRASLVPALQAIHPAAQENVAALAEILREEAAVLDSLVDEVLDSGPVHVSRLRALRPAIRRLVVQRMADDAAGGLAPGAARRAEEVAALGERGTTMLDIGNGVRAVAEYGVLRFEPIAPPVGAPETVFLSIPGSVRFGASEVRCELGPPVREPGVLDRAALGSELLVRSWRPGDRMAPLGLNGTKSLQDLFTARRVPRSQRPAVPVIEAAGEIAWVAGVATSERFKVTDSTRETVRLSAPPLD
jgi:tRNA(Ile)-lysidine synthase